MLPRPPFPRRRLAGLAAVLLAGLAAARAQAPGGAAPLRAWEVTGNFRTMFGHRENVLLSAVRPEDSAFAQAEGEVFLWRLPSERFEALAFANATFTRFLDSAENPHEWQAFAHAEARWFFPHNLQATATAEGYHLDQVFDLSVTDAERVTARLGVDGALASAAWRWEAPSGTWLELKPSAQRDRYDDRSDDHTQRFALATVGRKLFAGRLEVSVSAKTLRRDYDRRPRYTVAGRALPGTELVFRQREGEARAAVTWDRARRWTSATSASLGTNRDNGSGYFDYRLRALRQEIAWTRAPWKVRLVGRAARYDYDVQTEGIGIAPPPRVKEEFRARTRVERQWTQRATLYAEYTWERSRSNDPLANYRVKTAGAGVDWSF
ncbi:MAG: hypothetical protein NTV51_15085 [Verrucomicrobia bacterium]|nr:hypothetical protein [Verrucomicrobiota bacterium]